MRIGLVSPYDLSVPGGVQAQVLGLADYLGSVGDDVVVIGPGLPQDRPGVDLGASLALPGNRSSVPIAVNPGVLGLIRESTADLDLLHVHEPLMPMASLAALRSGPPVVATFHADPNLLVRRLYATVGTGLRRILGERVMAVTAVSTTAASALPGDLEVVIVPNGLELSKLKADVQRVVGRVVFLGRDEPRKGLDVLLDAWGSIVREIPAASLVVMGADRRIDGITWMGWVDDQVKAEMLSSAEVYVAPNTGGESFGIVLVEAMAAGAAVAASALPAFKEVAGDAARYFTPGDKESLSGTVIDLLNDSTPRSELARRGAARASDFDWSRVGPAYRQIYERILP